MIGDYCQQNYNPFVNENEGSDILWNNIKDAMCGGVF
jgi:hypothetical protein